MGGLLFLIRLSGIESAWPIQHVSIERMPSLTDDCRSRHIDAKSGANGFHKSQNVGRQLTPRSTASS